MESFEIEAADGKNRPYVTTKIACGEGIGHENDMYNLMQSASCLTVNASVQLSEKRCHLEDEKEICGGFDGGRNELAKAHSCKQV